MQKRCFSNLTGFLFLSLFILFCSIDSIKSQAANKRTLSAGTAKINITPKIPIPMSGYTGRKGPFKGVHDDLFARVIVFNDGENRTAIISADIIGFSNSLWEEITKRIEQEAGILQENILLCATHTHSGPTNRINDESPLPNVVSFVNELKERLVTCVKEAAGNLKPARIGAGIGECRMNISRRARNGKGGISLGRNPYGPCDHEVGVVKITDIQGNPTAIFVNWPCHGTVMGPRNYLISGDWPGAASRFIEKEFGNRIIAPLTLGASGDINPIYGPHIDFVDIKSYSYGIEAIGAILGEEVLRIAKDIKTFSNGSISASQRIITLPGKKRGESKLPQKKYEPGPDVDLLLSALKIGNIVFTGVAGDLMNEISVKVRKLSPFRYTYLIVHCNGRSGYFVTDYAYREGGYEVQSSRAMPGAEKVIIENLLDMINGL